MTLFRTLSCLLGLCTLATSVAAQSNGTIVGADYHLQIPVRVTSDQVITVYVTGIGEAIKSRVKASTAPWPTELAGISAELLFNTRGPIGIGQVEPVSTCPAYFQNRPESVAQLCGQMLAVTLQLPGLSIFPTAVQPQELLFLKEKGVRTRGLELIAVLGRLHILQTCDTAVRPELSILLISKETLNPCRPIVVRPDGSLVGILNPAREGEVLTIYGFGSFGPELWTDYRFGNDVRIGFGEMENRLRPEYIGPSPGQPGLSQMNFRVPPIPPELKPCSGRDTNLTLAIGPPKGPQFFFSEGFDSAGICVDPASRAAN